MGEDGRAVALNILIEQDAGLSLGQDRCERGLADLKQITPQVIAVQLDQVEGVQEHVGVVLPVADALEARPAAVITAHRLAVDDA
jgi:hypothetical protein